MVFPEKLIRLSLLQAKIKVVLMNKIMSAQVRHTRKLSSMIIIS